MLNFIKRILNNFLDVFKDDNPRDLKHHMVHEALKKDRGTPKRKSKQSSVKGKLSNKAKRKSGKLAKRTKRNKKRK